MMVENLQSFGKWADEFAVVLHLTFTVSHHSIDVLNIFNSLMAQQSMTLFYQIVSRFLGAS